MSTSTVGGMMTWIGLPGMMIGLGIIVGLHPGMSLLPLHHQHLKRVRTDLRLLLLNFLVPALLVQVPRFQP